MKKYLFLGYIVSFSFLGCSDNQADTKKTTASDSTQTAEVFEIKFHEDKPGKNAEANVYVRFHYNLTDETGDTIASTYIRNSPFEFLLEPLNEQDMTFKLLTQMSEGDSASFLTNAQTYYKSEGLKLPDSIRADTKYEFRAKVLSIQTIQEKVQEKKEQEDKILFNYVRQNYKDGFRDDKSGMYLVYETRGEGKPARPGDSVRFKYTVKHLDDRVLDSSDEQEVGLALIPDKVLAGWYLAFTKYMNIGTKVTLFLPSHLAFGTKATTLTYKNKTTSLSAFNILKCELELTNIYRRKP